MLVLPENRYRNELSLRLKVPELEKPLETQLRPRYAAHSDTSPELELTRRPEKSDERTVGLFKK